MPEGVTATAASTSGPITAPLERSGQFSVLEASLAAALSGSNGRLVLVSGEAGVGKTLLLRKTDHHRN